mmetsp:Transcript_42313/g.99251  ORF Transcript_42313/g.99251 Transcript_42313/m.99251 type:complete len:221 (+) Transcript_42313:4160-4822(+)
MGAARQPDRLSHLAQVVVHDQHVGGLLGGVGAGGAHRETNRRRGKARRVVDAVTHHADGAAGTQFADGGLLVLRQQLGANLVDAELARNGLRGRRVVAGQHDGRDAELAQRGDGLAAAGLGGVRHREQGEHAALVGQQRHGAPLGFVGLHGGFKRRRAQAMFVDPAVVAEQQGHAVNTASHAAAGCGRELVHRPCLAHQPAGDGLRDRVVGAGREAEREL